MEVPRPEPGISAHDSVILAVELLSQLLSEMQELRLHVAPETVTETVTVTVKASLLLIVTPHRLSKTLIVQQQSQ